MLIQAFPSLKANYSNFRYFIIDNFRLESIRLIKERRNQIINEENKLKDPNKLNHTTQNAYSNTKINTKTNSFFIRESTFGNLIHNEKEEIEKLKQRQKNDIQSMIEKEVLIEMMRSKTAEKEQKIKEKEEKLREEFQHKSKHDARRLKES